MPWEPEIFTAGALAGVADRHRAETPTLIPFFLGLMTGEIDAIVASFAGEPEVHHPVRGRIKGAAAFERYAAETSQWLAVRDVTVEDVGFIVTPRRRVEEVVLDLPGDDGRSELPMAVAVDLEEGAGIAEARIYFNTRPHAVRPPLLQPDPDIAVPDFIGATAPEPCAVTDDGHACALEYNAGAPPDACLAIYVRGDDGRLATTHVYGGPGRRTP